LLSLRTATQRFIAGRRRRKRWTKESRQSFLGLEIFPTTLINVAPNPYFSEVYERSGLLRQPGVRRIACWVWELEDIPAEWTALAPLIDEIWVPTKFVADAFRRRMPNPVREVMPPLRIGESKRVGKSQFSISPENYVFLFMFDMCSEMLRKNPLAVIRAFRCAFPDERDVSLIIKVSRGNYDPAGLNELQQAATGGGILLIDRVLPHAEVLGLVEMCDCFVSLHRAEGLGLCLAEAMALGKPVIATNYSGNLAFMHPGNSLLVDYTMKEIVEDNPVYAKGYCWADPSIEHAASHMRWCYEHRAEGAALGAIARAETGKQLSLEASGQRILELLRKI
jgi:glycosyltransferase involved in cell wall biosynthesis